MALTISDERTPFYGSVKSAYHKVNHNTDVIKTLHYVHFLMKNEITYKSAKSAKVQK